MAERTKPSKWQDMPFGETLARLFQARPEDAADAVASHVLRESEEDKKHRNRVEKALEDGARTGKGRFRL